MTFTSDWFTPHIPSWQAILSPTFTNTPCRALEIGSYEGRSAAWLLTNALTHPDARLTCVDTWVSAEMERRFDANMVETGASHKVEKRKGCSREILRNLGGPFDLVYIDGDHTFKGVLTDSVLAVPLVKPQGVVVWDDYQNGRFPGCRRAVDVFLGDWIDEFTILAKGLQMIVRKNA